MHKIDDSSVVLLLLLNIKFLLNLIFGDDILVVYTVTLVVDLFVYAVAYFVDAGLAGVVVFIYTLMGVVT